MIAMRVFRSRCGADVAAVGIEGVMAANGGGACCISAAPRGGVREPCFPAVPRCFPRHVLNCFQTRVVEGEQMVFFLANA